MTFLDKMAKQPFKSFLLIFWVICLPIDIHLNNIGWCLLETLFIAYHFTDINMYKIEDENKI